ncbi:MAG: phosphate ABC transporter permease PstA [Alphaproteobacteria bacterium]|nr:phosphate ABC transporter permease PstA [Alphaproteobacteria bacterium]
MSDREMEKPTPYIRADLLRRRYRAEKRFRLYGVVAIFLASAILITLLGAIAFSSIPAFTHTYIGLDFDLQAGDMTENIEDNNWHAILRKALYQQFPEVKTRRDKRMLGKLLSIGAADRLAHKFAANPSFVGQKVQVYLPASDDFDLFIKGAIDRTLPESDRLLSDKQIAWIDKLRAQARVKRQFASHVFLAGDSREPELAGIKGALIGSLLTMFVTLLFSLPIGIMAAIYLQEIAPKNRFTDLIEVNINNLAAVPSIVFGLLGLAVFINFFQLPRSTPLVGGLVLALMTLPVIIIAARAALASVPPSIREAALGVGASRLQVILHHILPLALPGILTGTIIGIARAAGETAPLLMVGMLAFIVDKPANITDKATVLPAQIYIWANNPERAFESLTSAAIIILLVFLLFMNATAIGLRKRYQKRW